MTVLAGVFSIAGDIVETPTISAIKKSFPGDDGQVETWRSDRLFVAKFDVGAFPDRAFCRPSNRNSDQSFAAMAGHTFLVKEGFAGHNRAKQLEYLRDQLDNDEIGVLSQCTGTFSLCHYNPRRQRLLLATDPVGSRPLYYCLDGKRLYFSSLLRILEELPYVPKRVDIQGVAESLAFSFPLADRTPYADIKVLENGQYLLIDDAQCGTHQYSRWDTVATRRQYDRNQCLDEAHQIFSDAVLRRCERQETVVATLSGGLDSRTVVVALHELEKKIFVATWAADGYLDGALATEFAERLGVPQVVRSIPAMPSWQDQIRCLDDLSWPGEEQPPSTQLIFSGDGGSVGVGYDYLTAERVAWLRAGEQERMVNYLTTGRFYQGCMNNSAFRQFQEAIIEGVRSEFNRIANDDPGRALHTFYMNNDQRRHLHEFYERIDCFRREYLLPFYDATFLRFLSSLPVDEFLLHRFYYDWLDRFPPIAKAVAWQSYPGHIKCPLPIDADGRTQWDKRRRDYFRGKNYAALRNFLPLLFRSKFPSEFNRSRLALAAILQTLQVRSYGGLLNACRQLYDWQRRCA